MKVVRPQQYDEAVYISTLVRAALPQGQQIQQQTIDDCFESIRLNVNLALDLHFATTTHPSQMMAVFMFGIFTGGLCRICYDTMRSTLGNGGMRIVHTDVLTLTETFEGERYELQFFLPQGVGERLEERHGRMYSETP